MVGIKVVKPNYDSTDLLLQVTESNEGIIENWDKRKIVSVLTTEINIPKEPAEKIANLVEKRVLSSGVKKITVNLIRELVNSELFSNGFTKKLEKHETIGMSFYDLDKLIVNKSNENSNVSANNPEAVNLAIAENSLKQYSLKKVFSEPISMAHLKGEIHLHDLSFPHRVYSFHKDECILVKINNICVTRSFKQLWDEINTNPVIENDFEIKYLKNIEVYDKNKKWTTLKKIVRHISNKKMLSIESENGSSVIITEDHPFITLKDKIPEYPCPKCNKLTFKTNGGGNGYKIYLCECGYQFRKKIINYNIENTINKPANTISKNNWLIESDMIDRNFVKSDKTIFPIDKEMAYFIGLFISEGSFGNTEINIAGKSHIPFVEKFAKKYDLSYGINKQETDIRIYSKKLINFLNTLNVGKKSDTKSMPKDFLRYKNEIINTIIAGIFDGDGSVKQNKNGATELLLRMTSRILLSQLKYWFGYKFVNNNLTYIGLSKPGIYNNVQIINKKPMYRLSFYLTEKTKNILENSVKFNNNKCILSEKIFNKKNIYKNKKIKNVKECIYKDKYVYDITTESGTFVCNGVVVHNCGSHSLEYIKKYGLKSLINLSTASSPAKHVGTLTGHLNTFLASMQSYYAGALGIAYLNVFYAPYLVGMTYKQIKQQAQYLIFSLSQNAFSRGNQTLFINLNIHLSVPDYLKNTKAIGPGGVYKGTYKDYEKETKLFTKALLEVWKEGDKNGQPFPFPICNLHIDKNTFVKDTELFKLACEATSENGCVYFVFDRDAVVLSACCRLKSTLKDFSIFKHPESIRYCGFQNVTINLPQASYRANGDLDKTIKEIENTMKVAVKAHLEKKKFIEKLMSKPGMPLWQIGKKSDDGKPYVDLETSTYIIGIIGLNECVKRITGKDLHESEEIYKIGLKIISSMYLKTKEFEKETGLTFSLEESPAESAGLRLAKIDLKNYPESKDFIRGDKRTGQIYYTNSVHFTPNSDIDITERIEKQSKFNTLIESGSITHVFLGEQKPDVNAIYSLVKKTWENTQCAQLVISPEFTVCNDCNKMSRGYNKDDPGCSYCNSKDVYGMSRVVGYYSKIENWNASKQAEFKARQKGNYGV